MPNWTTNKMMIHSADLHFLVNKEGQVDFDLIDPMPKSLDIGNLNDDINRFAMEVYAGSKTSIEQAPCVYAKFRLTYLDGEAGETVDLVSPTIDDYRRFGEILTRNVNLYGHADWYSWRTNPGHWGVKWNACDSHVGPADGDGMVLLSFLTPWDSPSSTLIGRLAGLCAHPIRFECTYEGEEPAVYDIRHKRLPLEDSLFSLHYFDEDGEEVSEERYKEILAAGDWAFPSLV